MLQIYFYTSCTELKLFQTYREAQTTSDSAVRNHISKALQIENSKSYLIFV